VTFDGHRSGHFEPYAFRTTDFGRTWTKVTTGIPSGDVVRTIHEYPGTPAVAFIGTERALYLTTNSGANWTRFKSNLPTVPTYDILVHPRTKDLILGTHGRSIWILDDASPIAAWSSTIASKPAHVFPSRPVTQYLFWEDFSNWGQGEYAGANPKDGALVSRLRTRPAASCERCKGPVRRGSYTASTGISVTRCCPPRACRCLTWLSKARAGAVDGAVAVDAAAEAGVGEERMPAWPPGAATIRIRMKCLARSGRAARSCRRVPTRSRYRLVTPARPKPFA
jgi:hypothetical protein